MLFTFQAKACRELRRPPRQLQRFAAIPPCERRYRCPNHSRKTHDRYVADAAACVTWCLKHRKSALPISASSLQAYFKLRRRGARRQSGRPPAMLHLLTSIYAYHRANGFPLPSSRALADEIEDVRRAHRRIKARPFTTEEIYAMCELAHLQHPLVGARDTALHTVGFASALRPANLLALQVDHIHRKPGGIYLFIPHSKTDQTGEGRFVTITPAEEGWCAIAALERWIELAGLHDGYVFCKIDRYGHPHNERPLTENSLLRIVRAYAHAVGCRGNVCGYSFRRGNATQSFANDAPVERIQRHLDHKREETTLGYIDRVPLRFDQSLTGLVLP